VLYAGWLTMALMADGEGQGGAFGQLFPFIVIFALFYFILIAPMRKKQKNLQKMISDLQNGDKIVTNGGIHGTVVGVSEQVIQLRVADQVKIEISRSAVAGLQAKPGEEKS